jgi:hypothetical protein
VRRVAEERVVILGCLEFRLIELKSVWGRGLGEVDEGNWILSGLLRADDVGIQTVSVSLMAVSWEMPSLLSPVPKYIN